MYSLEQYGRMIADRARMDAYDEALRRTVAPGSVVLDIGTGTGIMALMAARLGARRVYAVEPSPFIHVAARIAAENGLADRICFIQGRSQDLSLPEPADAIVSDLRGVLPLDPNHLPAIVDARERLLAPGGALVPQRDTLRFAAVESEQAWRLVVAPWRDSPYGFSMEAAADAARNHWGSTEARERRLLTAAGELAAVDYRTVARPNLDATAEVEATQDGTAHGFLIWFDAELAEGVGFSNAPDRPDLVYGRAFFPLLEPTALRTGWRVRIRLRAVPAGDGYGWFWRWWAIDGSGAEQARSATEQSTLLARAPSPRVAHAIAADDVPSLRADGEVVRELLALVDGRRSVLELAEQLAERYPDRFAVGPEAEELVRDVVERYGSLGRGPASGIG